MIKPAINLVTPSGFDPATSHFAQKDGLCYAGSHLLVDLWQAERLADLAHVEATLREAVTRRVEPTQPATTACWAGSKAS